MSKKDFIPALNLRLLTPLYDAVAFVIFGRIYPKIIRSLPLQKHGHVLDVGCGTGTLLIKMLEFDSSLKLTGIDIDPAILKIGEKKLEKLGKPFPKIDLIEASATDLPFKDESFELVTTTAMFHHLSTTQKKAAFKEIYRVLKPGGELYFYDFAKPGRLWGWVPARIYRHIEEIEDGIRGRIPGMMEKAGFRALCTHWSSYGMLSLISAQKPR